MKTRESGGIALPLFTSAVVQFTWQCAFNCSGYVSKILLAVAERTVFARCNTAIVGSNPTEAWMFVCVLCAFFLFLHSLKGDSQPT
jgi:hypothetical protein